MPSISTEITNKSSIYTHTHTHPNHPIMASKNHIKLLSGNYKGNKSQVSLCTDEKLSHFHKIMRNYPLVFVPYFHKQQHLRDQ